MPMAIYRVCAVVALMAASFLVRPAPAGTAPTSASLIAEVRRTFTVGGKPIPPEIFRDFGDGDLADSGSIWVTVDVNAASGSNLYFDDVKQQMGQPEEDGQQGRRRRGDGLFLLRLHRKRPSRRPRLL